MAHRNRQRTLAKSKSRLFETKLTEHEKSLAHKRAWFLVYKTDFHLKLRESPLATGAGGRDVQERQQ